MEASRTHEFELQQPPSDGISRVRFVRDSHLLLTSSWDGVRNLPKILNFTSPLMSCFVVQGVRLYDAAQNVLKDQYSHKVGDSSHFVDHLFCCLLNLSILPQGCRARRGVGWPITRLLRRHGPKGRHVRTNQPPANLCSLFLALSCEAVCLTRASHTAVRRHDWTTQTESIFGTHEKAVRCLEYSEPQGPIFHHSWPASDLLLTPVCDCSGLLFSGSWDSTVQVWDVSARQCVQTIALPDKGKALSYCCQID
jgi:WD40 repeat protein